MKVTVGKYRKLRQTIKFVKSSAATLLIDYEVPLASDEGRIDERWWACWQRTAGIAPGRTPEDYRLIGEVLSVRCAPGGIDREMLAIEAMVAEANLCYQRGSSG